MICPISWDRAGCLEPWRCSVSQLGPPFHLIPREVESMKRTVLLSAVAALLPAPRRHAPDEPKNVGGSGAPAEGTVKGEKMPDTHLSTTELILTEDKYITIVGEGKEEGTFKVDFSKKPATVDIQPTMGQNK